MKRPPFSCAPNAGFRLLLPATGPVRARLEELARNLGVADWVTFLGFREDVSDLLAACDLVVLPSLREGLSIALLEAMAAGKPIIATSIGSHRELASQAEIAQPRARRLMHQRFVKRFCRSARNPALRARLGANARTLFESQYTEERMLNTYKQLYFDLVRREMPGRGLSDRRRSNVQGAAGLGRRN